MGEAAGAGRMHATARVVAAAGPGGGTILPELRSAGPLLLRRTGARGGDAHVHLVGGAAGPLGGDRWRLEIEVGPGAVLRLRSTAASVALPGPDGAASRLEVVAVVAAGGLLDWAPEPLVAAAGARHRTVARVEVAAGGGLRWREELVCGRHGEASGAASSLLTVRHEGRPLVAHEVAVGPEAPGWDSPAVLGAARATGTLLLAGTACPPESVTGDDARGANFAIMRLIGTGVLVTALGDDGLLVGHVLRSAEESLSGMSGFGTNHQERVNCS